MNEPEFKNYKEKQNYYKELYQNREKTIWLSKMIGRDGKVLQTGRTYTSQAREEKKFRKRAKEEAKKHR